MNKVKAVAISIAFLISGAFGGEAEAISVVKKGSLGACPNYTLEEVVNNFMEKPKWKHTVDKNGINYVTVSGITSSGRPANVAMQFWVRKKEFGYQASEINGVPQNVLELVVLTNKMCESTHKATEPARLREEELRKANAAQEAAREAETYIKANSGTFTDSRDKKNYKTIKIGSQVWMAENLNYEVKGFLAKLTGNSKCYDNQEKNCTKYGKLYDRETAIKACPNGWHLPTKVEWDKLTEVVGDDSRYLKATSGWNDGEWNNGNGEDKFGFSALPGGYGDSDGNFKYVGGDGFWWSASEDKLSGLPTEFTPDPRYLGYNLRLWGVYNNSHLLSVRCVQD